MIVNGLEFMHNSCTPITDNKAMIDLLVYLLAVCQNQAQELAAAKLVIEEQAAALADVDSLILSMDGDLSFLEEELDAIGELC